MFGCVLARNKNYLASKKPNPCRVKKDSVRTITLKIKKKKFDVNICCF